MSDIADKIYAATGLTLNAEAAAKIGQMIQQARRDALEEAAQALTPMFHSTTWRSQIVGIKRAFDIIRALGEKQ